VFLQYIAIQIVRELHDHTCEILPQAESGCEIHYLVYIRTQGHKSGKIYRKCPENKAENHCRKQNDVV